MSGQKSIPLGFSLNMYRFECSFILWPMGHFTGILRNSLMIPSWGDNFTCVSVGDLLVIVQIYSSLPDPEWTITTKDPNYKAISTLLLAAKNTRLTHSIEATPARLGFKGFIVTEGNAAHLLLGKETEKLHSLLLESRAEGLNSRQQPTRNWDRDHFKCCQTRDCPREVQTLLAPLRHEPMVRDCCKTLQQLLRLCEYKTDEYLCSTWSRKGI